MIDGRELNPLGNFFDALKLILDNTTIKYSGKANDHETLESRQNGDGYIAALNKQDTFFSYNDYTESELVIAGITDYKIRRKALTGDIRSIPDKYRDKLLELRRARCNDRFEEKNDYYRELNGYPPSSDSDVFYTPSSIAQTFEIDTNIPIHKVQDYYNKKEKGLGDYFIKIIEDQGIIKDLISRYPDKTYLKYIGSRRISIPNLRQAKNFQIVQFLAPDVKNALINEFLNLYEQCREYYVTVIYNYNFRSFMERYDNFIAMCIMLMAIHQVSVRQMFDGINRNYFDIYAVKYLYEAYDIPFDLDIDEDTQNSLLRNINLLIQNKGTDKVIFDIAGLLGFSNIKVYKYFLGKERRFDVYGVPIVKFKTQFNSDTGENETVYDYESMYDIYFQKFEVRDTDFSKTFTNPANKVDYKDTISRDPLWVNDQKLQDMLYQTEFNFVESKYFSIGVSYSITNVIFENILLLKMMLQKKDFYGDIYVTLPRILGTNTKVSLFDTIIALICLTACKHNLYGEIVSRPTQVVSVLDYLRNREGVDMNIDTLKFNYNYFFNPNEEDDNDEMVALRDEVIAYIQNINRKPVDTFGFNFKYFDMDDPKTQVKLDQVRWALSESDYLKFREYISIIMQKDNENVDKIKAINDIYTNIRNLKNLLSYYMTSICNNKREYEKLRRMYDSLFYSEEVNDVFTITGSTTGVKRTAYTYFEYLRYINLELYESLFEVDMYTEYNKYLEGHSISSDEMSYANFIREVEYGSIFIDYSTFKGLNNPEVDYKEFKDERIYFYINHIISRLRTVFDNVDFMYTINDTNTPLSDLLIRLIKFFKSYTVDMISMDTLFVYDLKPENLMKFFDEIHHMNKDSSVNDNLHVSYGDVIHSMEANINTYKDKSEHTYLNDNMIFDANIVFNHEYGIYKEHPELLSLLMKDKFAKIESNIVTPFSDGGNTIKTFDTVDINSTLHSSDNAGFSDKLVKTWYS